MVKPEEVLSFWLDEVEPSNWYMSTPELDQEIRDRFAEAWEDVQMGRYGLWLTYPTGTLAYIILTDQLPRNMFRDDARAFQTDKYGLAAAKAAVDRKWDLRIDEPARQFFYLPMMHSENLCDQERCVRLMKERLSGDSNLLHAKVHREIIRQFGRFPYRNEALERKFTPAEQSFLADGGYRKTLQDIQAVTA